MSKILAVNKLTRTFKSGSRQLTVVNNIIFEIEAGTSCAIVGPSGSGKTTLLGLCAGLDRPSSGEVILTGVNLNPLNEDERALVRNQHVGFVFQTFLFYPSARKISRGGFEWMPRVLASPINNTSPIRIITSLARILKLGTKSISK